MIKLVYCVKQRNDISPEEFHRYWLEEHRVLVKRLAITIRIRRYGQSHRIETEMNDFFRLSKGTGEPYDVITEIWWDSWDELAAAGSPEGIEADKTLLEDERKFVDHARSVVFLTEEHEILETQ
ncbi:MAG: EthD domain-containing protein [Chloroflexi bacterium]|nr:EthD domain-containing protein [Chloroflexota bacterium]